MAVTSYDAMEVTVTVNGTFITGFTDGSFVECEKDEDHFSTSVGAQGDVVVSEINNPLGTIKLTLQATSPSIAFLNKLAKQKEMSDIWVISNGEPKEKTGGTQARIKKQAAVTYSDEAEDREFEIVVLDYTQE
ncbi:phage protein [Brevibacillus laterosporus]|uniref:phage structural protein n=1 Tax=Brevibacillus laterosporus TaxID=1465 RepID=UPI003D1B86DD